MYSNIDYIPNLLVASQAHVRAAIDGDPPDYGQRGAREECNKAHFFKTRPHGKRKIRAAGSNARLIRRVHKS